MAPPLGQVYVLNRDTASRLAISSPLEAHKSNAIVFHTCGVDVGFDNPIFAVSCMSCLSLCVGLFCNFQSASNVYVHLWNVGLYGVLAVFKPSLYAVSTALPYIG